LVIGRIFEQEIYSTYFTNGHHPISKYFALIAYTIESYD
jgi:hypothetical protein